MTKYMTGYMIEYITRYMIGSIITENIVACSCGIQDIIVELVARYANRVI